MLLNFLTVSFGCWEMISKYRFSFAVSYSLLCFHFIFKMKVMLVECSVPLIAKSVLLSSLKSPGSC